MSLRYIVNQIESLWGSGREQNLSCVLTEISNVGRYEVESSDKNKSCWRPPAAVSPSSPPEVVGQMPPTVRVWEGVAGGLGVGVQVPDAPAADLAILGVVIAGEGQGREAAQRPALLG